MLPPESARSGAPYHSGVHDGEVMSLILIGLGGFAGAISRYLVDGFVSDRTGGGFPWGTLVVNCQRVVRARAAVRDDRPSGPSSRPRSAAR